MIIYRDIEIVVAILMMLYGLTLISNELPIGVGICGIAYLIGIDWSRYEDHK